MQPYIPTKQNDADAWLTNFCNLAVASPGTYGLTAGDAASIQSACASFTAALGLVNNPATKTKVTVQAKNNAWSAVLATVRPYAQQIRQNLGVSDADKQAIGINPLNPNPSPVPAPATQPLLAVIAATPGSQTVRFADANTPNKRAKPPGATGLLLFVAIGTAPATDPTVAVFRGQFNKQPIGVSFGTGDMGKVATYFGRWTNRKGEMGPWSAAASLTVA